MHETRPHQATSGSDSLSQSGASGNGAPNPDGGLVLDRARDTSAPESVAGLPRPAQRRVRRLGWYAALVGVCMVALVLILESGLTTRLLHGADGSKVDAPPGDKGDAIPVNIARPRKKTLERTLIQPGSIQAAAEVDLYSKASGYLHFIQRVPTSKSAAGLVDMRCFASVFPTTIAARVTVAVSDSWSKSPQIDIGSSVSAGEMLLEIDTPERIQEIVEKESILKQREAELEAARTALATFDAAILAAKAQCVEAEADVRRYESEHAFRTKELIRWKELARSETVTPQLIDEKQDQVNAALAAWESSLAKTKTAQAESAVVSSKLATAHADLKVKEALVRVAADALRQSHIQADYRHVRAPFDGVITYRGIDEGDFIQSAAGGQPRRLMTVAAIDTVKVVIQVPERDTPWIHVGGEATVALDAWGGREVPGRVARVASALDPSTRTMRAEIDLDNPDRRLLPGMYGKVTLTLQKIADAYAVPATALYSRKGENFILLVRDGVAHRQKVRIRYDDGREVEVVKLINGREIPLSETDELVVSNKGELAEGQRVRTTLLSY